MDPFHLASYGTCSYSLKGKKVAGSMVLDKRCFGVCNEQQSKYELRPFRFEGSHISFVLSISQNKLARPLVLGKN
jgi:hypothetical protein